MVKPARPHTRFEKARIIGARALQISMGAPLFVSEDELRDHFSDELIQLYGVEEAQTDCDDATFPSSTPQSIEQCHQATSTSGAERVTYCNCSTMRVESVLSDAQ